MIHSLALLFIASQDSAHNYRDEQPGKWEATAEFLRLPGKDKLTAFANQEIKNLVKNSYDAFVKEARKEFKAGNIDQPWSYDTSVTHGLHDKTMISVVVNTDRYMGGAHGLAVTKAYNYGLVSGKPKRLGVWDVFKKANRKQLEATILKEAKKDPNTDWLHDEGVPFRGLDDEQLANFWMKKRGEYIWEFAPYELGSYASGPFTFKFSSQALKKFLR